MKKYQLTHETLNHNGHTLHRIVALKDFANIKAGNLGGWIESEYNLSQEGDCWIFGDAWVRGNAQVFDDARVCDTAQVFDDARVFSSAQVYGDAWIYGNAQVFGDAQVFDNAQVFGDARVFANAQIYGNARLFTPLILTSDYLCVGPIGSRNDYVTFVKNGDEIYVATGCFRGTLEEFRQAVSKTHNSNVHAENYNKVISYITDYFS